MGSCSLLFAVVVLLGLPDSSQARESDPITARSLSVVSLNLWHDKADWPKRQARIVLVLAKLRPDVIALQEVLQDRDLPNQAMTLARSLGYHYRFASVDAPRSERRYGNALLTRHPIRADGSVALQPLDDYRTALHVRIAINDQEVDVYATHLHYQPAGGDIRRQQVEDLMAHARNTSAQRPSLIIGDFNIGADAPELSALMARYVDSYDRCHPDAAQDDPQHSTLNLAFHPAQRIDHVFFDPEWFSLQSARRLFTQPYSDGDWASDHFGVLATLRHVNADRTPGAACQARQQRAN